MPITFPNLPGVNVDIQEGGLTITKPPSGPKIVLLGVSTASGVQATPFDPYPIGRPDEAATYFNNIDGTVSELTQALYECYIAGGRNIELVNIWPSGYAGDPTDDERYNALDTAYTNLLNHDADIVVPVNATIDATGLSAGRNFGYQLADFCYRATRENNTAIGVIGAKTAITSASGTPTLQELSTWVTDLANFTNNSIYDGSTDADADGKPDNYAFWATTDSAIPVGNPPQDDAQVIKDGKNNPVDIGSYISVVAADERFSNDAAASLYPDIGYYNANAASAYAGLVSSLPAKSAPTNKLLTGASVQRNISLAQADSLVGSRYVTCIDKAKGLVVASAVTGAYNVDQYRRSDYVRLTTVRIVHDVINTVRDTADSYVGEPNTAPQRNALGAAIDSALKSLQSAGALQRYRFNIFSSPSDRVLGKATVELVLVPAFELTEITCIISLATS